MPQLTERFAQAWQLAFQLHRAQLRKGSNVPYIAHLMGVTALVLEHGGDEDQAVAALLHDAVEDQGGRKTLEQIQSQFGERVARIVEGLTDSYEIPKPPWLKRKERYLQKLAEEPTEVLLVSIADKVHNARAILRDLSTDGERVWDRFNGGKEGTIWYYRSLGEFFKNREDLPLVGEFMQLVEEIVAGARRSSE